MANKLKEDCGEDVDVFVSAWQKVKGLVGEVDLKNNKEVLKFEANLKRSNAESVKNDAIANEELFSNNHEIKENIAKPNVEVREDDLVETGQVGPGTSIFQSTDGSLAPTEDDEIENSRRISIASSTDSDSLFANLSSPPENTSELNEFSVSKLAEILEKNESNTSDIDHNSEIIILVGATGSGKTTFLKAITGHELYLKKLDDTNKEVWDIEDDQDDQDIGHSFQSLTGALKCEVFSGPSTHVIDTPGFADTRNIAIDIATSISIRNVASKAKRVRFVVLINTHSIHADRAVGLRKNLEHVSKFIGDNFRAHEKAFTFLFSHCKDTIDALKQESYTEKSYTAAEKEKVLKVAREQLRSFISEAFFSTNDLKVQKLIDFLQKSLKKNSAHCDIFDPLFSNIAHLKEKIGMNSHSISNPREVIECNLSGDSRLTLNKEMSKRKSSIDRDLKVTDYSETSIQENATSLCTTAKFIADRELEKIVEEMMNSLEGKSTDLKNSIHDAVIRGTDKVGSERFTMFDAKKAKIEMESLEFIERVRTECASILGNTQDASSNVPMSKDEQLSTTQKSIKVMADTLLSEASSLSEFLINGDGNGSAASRPINFVLIRKKLESLRSWGEAFGGEIDSIHQECRNSVCEEVSKSFKQAVHMARNSDGIVYSAPISLRTVASLKHLKISGLKEDILKWEEKNGSSFWESLKEEVLHSDTNIVLDKLLDVAQDTIKSAFEGPNCVSNTTNTSKADNFVIKFCGVEQVMADIVQAHKVIQQENLEEVLKRGSVHDKAMAYAAVEFILRCEMCSRLIEIIDNDPSNASTLEICFQSLKIFSDSIPASMIYEGNIIKNKEIIVRKMERKIEEIRVRMAMIIEQSPQNEKEYQKRALESLKSCMWFDEARTEYSDDLKLVVKEAVDGIRNLYIDCSEKLSASSDKLLDVILESNESLGNDEILEGTRKIVQSTGTLKSIADVSFEEDKATSIRKRNNVLQRVLKWNKSKLKTNLKKLMDLKKYDEIEAIILIASALAPLDSYGETENSRLIAHISNEFSVYSRTVKSKMEQKDGFQLKRSILTESKKWKNYNFLSKKVPTFEELKSIVKAELASHSESAMQRLVDSKYSEIKNIEKSVDYLSSAREHIDDQLNGEVGELLNKLNTAIEKRRAHINEKFIELIQSNKFGPIASHIQRLKSSNEEKDKKEYHNSIKVLSLHLLGTIQRLHDFIAYPLNVHKYKEEEVLALWKSIVEARNELKRTIDSFPPSKLQPGTWTLDEKLRSLDSEAKESRRKSVEEVKFAIQKYKFSDAYRRVKHAKILQKILTQLPGNIANKFRNQVEIRKPVDMEEMINDSLRKLEGGIEEFLLSLEPGTSNVSRKFSPETKFMRSGLENLKIASADTEVPIETREKYTIFSQRISGGLESARKKLNLEAEKGRFARSIDVLSFLNGELKTRELEKHVKVSFDPIAELNRVNELKRERSTSIDLRNLEEIDRYAKMLNELFSEEGTWPRKDYQHHADIISRFANNIVQETRDDIQRNNYDGLRGNIVLIDAMRFKLSKHLPKIQRSSQELVRLYSDQLDELLADMEALLEADGLDRLSSRFSDFKSLMEDVTIKTSGAQDAKSIIPNFDKKCEFIQSKFHQSLLFYTKNRLDSFYSTIKKGKFDDSRKIAANLRNLGFFLASDFEHYKSVVKPSTSETSLKELTVIFGESFASGEFLRVAESVASLNLSKSSEYGDIEKAFEAIKSSLNSDEGETGKLEIEKLNRIKKARDYLTQNSRTLTRYSNYDFLYLRNTIEKFPNAFEKEIRHALERNDYVRVDQTCLSLKEFEYITSLAKDPKLSLPINVEERREWAHERVRQKAGGLRKDIVKASADGNFKELYHSFSALEDLEKAFNSVPQIVAESTTAAVLEDMKQNIENLKEDCSAIYGKDEKYAFQKLEDFGLNLIKMGRFLDGFPQLKDTTATAIYMVLNNIRKESWGMKFLFRLGMRLEKGDISKERHEDLIVGRTIVSSFSHFKDVRTLFFNHRSRITSDVGKSIREVYTQKFDGKSKMMDVPIDKKLLKQAFDLYDSSFKEYFSDYIAEGPSKLVLEVKKMAQKLKPCKISRWDNNVKNLIPKITAGIFATFSIMKSGVTYKILAENSNEGSKIGQIFGRDSKNSSTKTGIDDVIFKPHHAQILALFRLLGIGTDSTTLRNQIMQIRTGEGKSIILGALSIVLALLGFSVRCVCYSEYLSDRDYDLFKDIFIQYDVESKIVYSKITTMSEDRIADKGDIREMTLDLLTGRNQEQLSKNLKRKSIDVVEKNEVLLVDEVDVFFGSDFYGQTYNQVAHLEDDMIETLLREIWSNRNSFSKGGANMERVKSWNIYNAVLRKYSQWKFLLESEVEAMVDDVLNYDNPPYEKDAQNFRIGYVVRDNVEWGIVYGYRTAFAHLAEQEKEIFVGDTAEANIKESLRLAVSCGQFSYSNIKPGLILGVTGTLDELAIEEKKIIQDFRVDTYTFMPSVYPGQRLIFEVQGRGIEVHSKNDDYLQNIAQEINGMVRKGRAAIAFFKDEAKLHEFVNSSHWRKFPHANILDGKANKNDRNHRINKAATSKQVTVATSAFGRGTDFFCTDETFLDKGGLHIIQTFLSIEKSEEIQIKGRTARQGQKGSYCMILLEKDIEESVGVKAEELRSIPRQGLYQFLDETRRKKHVETLDHCRQSLKKAEERDKESRAYFDALIRKDYDTAKKKFRKVYSSIRSSASGASGLEFCRMVILSDATGSMRPVWDDMRMSLGKMLKRIEDIGKGQFSLLWVAYRDYNSGRKKLLEASNWSKSAEDLIPFVSKIVCEGGGRDVNGAEAVEWALKFVNEEHARSTVSRVLLLADAPPHEERIGENLQSHRKIMETDYYLETEKLRNTKIPVFSVRFSPAEFLEKPFEYISDQTDGSSVYIDMNDAHRTERLFEFVCETVVEGVGGSDLVAEYRAKYGS